VDMGAYETSIPITIPGGAGANGFWANIAPDDGHFTIYLGPGPNPNPVGPPVADVDPTVYGDYTLEGGSSDDVFLFDASQGNPDDGQINIVGGDGNDTLIIYNTKGNPDLSVDSVQTVLDSLPINLDSVENIILDGPDGGSIQLGSLSTTRDVAVAAGHHLTLT